jgi:hypothetical protein
MTSLVLADEAGAVAGTVEGDRLMAVVTRCAEESVA